MQNTTFITSDLMNDIYKSPEYLQTMSVCDDGYMVNQKSE